MNISLAKMLLLFIDGGIGLYNKYLKPKCTPEKCYWFPVKTFEEGFDFKWANHRLKCPNYERKESVEELGVDFNRKVYHKYGVKNIELSFMYVYSHDGKSDAEDRSVELDREHRLVSFKLEKSAGVPTDILIILQINLIIGEGFPFNQILERMAICSFDLSKRVFCSEGSIEPLIIKNNLLLINEKEGLRIKIDQDEKYYLITAEFIIDSPSSKIE